MIRSSFISFYILFIACSSSANDGSYYMSGNQLIPVMESEIRISKEVLQIKRIDDEWVKITVDYVFDNPGKSKKIIVGFEASAPSGDADIGEWSSTHPYMQGFEVVMNDQPIPFKSTIVSEDAYYRDGKILGSSRMYVSGPEDLIGKMFVYYFDANFKTGLNFIHHEYSYRMANSVISQCEISYVLTAANRWANHRIEDFTLLLDMGEYTAFEVEPTFFRGTTGWSNVQLAKADWHPYWIQTHTALRFNCMKFHPKGELYIRIPWLEQSGGGSDSFDSRKMSLPYNLIDFVYPSEARNEESYKILRNYPYARRGYIFKTDFIRAYYQRMPWYFEDPSYIADIEKLTTSEKNWLQKLNTAYRH